ncbi:hypothetical protein CR513_04767, partial [Mucuna pruriens]
MKKALLNATIMLIIEINSATSPDINFKGSDLRKSSSAYREMRIDKKIRIEVDEEINAKASDNANTRNEDPELSLLPPGTLNAAENTPVAIRVETTMQEFAVRFIHDSPFFSNSSCSLVNSSLGIMPS